MAWRHISECLESGLVDGMIGEAGGGAPSQPKERAGTEAPAKFRGRTIMPKGRGPEAHASKALVRPALPAGRHRYVAQPHGLPRPAAYLCLVTVDGVRVDHAAPHEMTIA